MIYYTRSRVPIIPSLGPKTDIKEKEKRNERRISDTGCKRITGSVADKLRFRVSKHEMVP